MNHEITYIRQAYKKLYTLRSKTLSKIENPHVSSLMSVVVRCFDIHSFIHSFIYLLRITSTNKTVCNAM